MIPQKQISAELKNFLNAISFQKIKICYLNFQSRQSNRVWHILFYTLVIYHFPHYRNAMMGKTAKATKYLALILQTKTQWCSSSGVGMAVVPA